MLCKSKQPSNKNNFSLSTTVKVHFYGFFIVIINFICKNLLNEKGLLKTIKFPAVFVLLIWVVKIYEYYFDLKLYEFGVFPRKLWVVEYYVHHLFILILHIY